MVSTINRNLITWFTHIFLAERVTGIVPSGTHNYEKFITPNELEGMMSSKGLEIVGRKMLDLNWKGEFEETQGGGNYILLGRKTA